MKGFFYSNLLFVGEIDYSKELYSKTEIGMGGICGEFFPNENYKLIRKEIHEWNNSIFNSTLRDSQNLDWVKWYSMNFNIQLENGYFLLPEGGYEISDFIDFPQEPLEVRTAGIHSHIFEDYFVQNKPFLNEFWRKISIQEKLEFEEKFQKATSIDKIKSFSINLSQKPRFSALAFNIQNEKVLFSTSWTKTNYFSIIDFHQKDVEGNPTFEFFGSFEEFL